MKSKRVRDAIASLDGMSFNCREAVEDAIFPLYSPLTEVFHGEGHRDLVDRLIRTRWLEVVQGKWTLTLPSLDKFPTPAEELSLNSGPEQPPVAVIPQDTGIAKNNAMAAILRDDYKEAIRILATLL